MQLKNLFKQLKLAVPASLFVFLMVLNYSCETTSEELCEEAGGICEEVVIACTSSNEEYYVLSGDTIYCEAVEDCGAAEDSLIIKCTPVASIKDEIEVRQQLATIMNNVRSMTF